MAERKLKEISTKQVKVRDAFWSPVQELVIDKVIPYQEQILNDAVPGAEKSHAIMNFRIAAKEAEGEYYGMVFQDSDVAKWIEGAAYSLNIREDSELEQRIDSIIDTIAKAQLPDGYLDTYFTIKEPDRKWADLLEGHELYCAGHMIEAAVAYYQVTGKDRLLNVAKKLADHIDSRFGSGKEPGIPGHQEIEVGLMRLYRVTGEERYAKLAACFLDRRGQDPDYFAKEAEKRDWQIFGMDPKDTDYNQSMKPVKEQTEAVGHAVRATYMYKAMADVATSTGDDEMLQAAKALWENITEKKMFVTGGIGSDGRQEAFSKDYYLPNDQCYNETCAQIAMLFFTKELLDAEPDGKYTDIMDLLLYNSTISGMQQDGRHFFYVNPLEVNPGISGELYGHEHVIPQRPGWYACACCPPNLVRMVTSLGKYAWSESEDTIYSHLLIGQEAELGKASVVVESKYPWEGYVRYQVTGKGDGAFRLAVHIPGFVKTIEVKRNGIRVDADGHCRDGYLYLDGFGGGEETVEVTFDLQVRRLYANPKVIDDAGCVSFARGPVVYCFEGVDNTEMLQNLSVKDGGGISEFIGEGILEHAVCLKIDGRERKDSDVYEHRLYSEEKPVYADRQLVAVPYYLWGNRGLTQMRVWLQER